MIMISPIAPTVMTVGVAIAAVTAQIREGAVELPECVRALPWIGADLQAMVGELTRDPEALRVQLTEWVRQGSNLVLTGDFDGLMLHMAIPGKRLVKEDAEAWYIEAGAGENWHDFVQWTLAEGWPGLENLSLIPGTVGAAPIIRSSASRAKK